MNEAIDLEARLLGEGKAERTVNEYVKWAKRLSRWCYLRGLEPATLTPAQLREWIDETVPPGRESRKQAYTACKHLYTMIGRDDAPWEAIRVPHARKGKPNPLPDSAATLLRDTALLVGGRTGTATLGMLYTACRPSEVAEWRWDGIDLDAGLVRFWRIKNRDWHETPIHPTLAAALERFRPAHVEGFLFPGDRGRPSVSATTIWTWVRRVADTAGLEGVTPRRLRATALNRALETTRDIDAVAELAGHSDPATTRLYYVTTSRRRLAATVDALDYD